MGWKFLIVCPGTGRAARPARDQPGDVGYFLGIGAPVIMVPGPFGVTQTMWEYFVGAAALVLSDASAVCSS